MFVFAYCFLHGDIVFLVYYGHYCQQQCYAYSESFRRGEILVGYMPLVVLLQYREKNLFMLVKWNWTKSLFLLAKRRSKLQWKESKSGDVFKSRSQTWLLMALRERWQWTQAYFFHRLLLVISLLSTWYVFLSYSVLIRSVVWPI